VRLSRNDACDMCNTDPTEIAYREIRELCLTDPLAARHKLAALLQTRNLLFEKIVERASEPDDSRLRQTIARTLQRRPEARKFSMQLREWHARETDEFTLSAIDDALNVEPSTPRKPRRPTEPEDLAATYRYLSGRLRHRVLNAMPRAGFNIEQVRTALIQSGAPQVERFLRQLDEVTDSLRAVQSAVDFEDEARIFERQAIDLLQWSKELALRYQRSFAEVSIRIDGGEPGGRIIATTFLLETIFLNLWDNSRQVVAGRCCIVLRIRVSRRTVTVQVLDNGPGLVPEDVHRAFQLQYSATRRPGRGHMEVNDAVRRLGGTAKVQKIVGAGYRVVLRLPRGEA
jgi:signal transduction histidine kinase